MAASRDPRARTASPRIQRAGSIFFKSFASTFTRAFVPESGHTSAAHGFGCETCSSMVYRERQLLTVLPETANWRRVDTTRTPTISRGLVAAGGLVILCGGAVVASGPISGDTQEAAAVGGYVTVFDPLNRVGAGVGTGSGVGATTPGAPSRYTEEDEQRQVHPNLQPRSAGAGSDRGECSPVAADAELPLLLHIEPSLQEHTRNHHGDVSLTP